MLKHGRDSRLLGMWVFRSLSAGLISLQQALADWEKSASAWQKALDALPQTNLSPAEKQQKNQYTTSLRAVKARIEAAIADPFVPMTFNEKDGKFPWQVAAEMLPELRKTATSSNIQNLSSSVSVHRDSVCPR